MGRYRYEYPCRHGSPAGPPTRNRSLAKRPPLTALLLSISLALLAALLSSASSRRASDLTDHAARLFEMASPDQHMPEPQALAVPALLIHGAHPSTVLKKVQPCSSALPACSVHRAYLKPLSTITLEPTPCLSSTSPLDAALPCQSQALHHTWSPRGSDGLPLLMHPQHPFSVGPLSYSTPPTGNPRFHLCLPHVNGLTDPNQTHITVTAYSAIPTKELKHLESYITDTYTLLASPPETDPSSSRHRDSLVKSRPAFRVENLPATGAANTPAPVTHSVSLQCDISSPPQLLLASNLLRNITKIKTGPYTNTHKLTDKHTQYRIDDHYAASGKTHLQWVLSSEEWELQGRAERDETCVLVEPVYYDKKGYEKPLLGGLSTEQARATLAAISMHLFQQIHSGRLDRGQIATAEELLNTLTFTRVWKASPHTTYALCNTPSAEAKYQLLFLTTAAVFIEDFSPAVDSLIHLRFKIPEARQLADTEASERQEPPEVTLYRQVQQAHFYPGHSILIVCNKSYHPDALFLLATIAMESLITGQVPASDQPIHNSPLNHPDVQTALNTILSGATAHPDTPPQEYWGQLALPPLVLPIPQSSPKTLFTGNLRFCPYVDAQGRILYYHAPNSDLVDRLTVSLYHPEHFARVLLAHPQGKVTITAHLYAAIHPVIHHWGKLPATYLPGSLTSTVLHFGSQASSVLGIAARKVKGTVKPAMIKVYEKAEERKAIFIKYAAALQTNPGAIWKPPPHALTRRRTPPS